MKVSLLLEMGRCLLGEIAEHPGADELDPPAASLHDSDAVELSVFEPNNLSPREPMREGKTLYCNAFFVTADASTRNPETAQEQNDVADEQRTAKFPRDHQSYHQHCHADQASDHHQTAPAGRGNTSAAPSGLPHRGVSERVRLSPRNLKRARPIADRPPTMSALTQQCTLSKSVRSATDQS